MPIRADIELDAGAKTFGSGLLVELIAALRRTRPGDLVAVVSAEPGVGDELEAWCRFTRNSLVDATRDDGRHRWVIRCGEAPADAEVERPLGSRLWLYTNFDCNLRCDYCCVRSSPKAPRRALGLERVRRIAGEARALGVSEQAKFACVARRCPRIWASSSLFAAAQQRGRLRHAGSDRVSTIIEHARATKKAK